MFRRFGVICQSSLHHQLLSGEDMVYTFLLDFYFEWLEAKMAAGVRAAYEMRKSRRVHKVVWPSGPVKIHSGALALAHSIDCIRFQIRRVL